MTEMADNGFNPHPARKPDATPLISVALGVGHNVSILTRPESRMQLHMVPA